METTKKEEESRGPSVIESLTENTNYFIFLITLEGDISTWNDQAQRVTGFSDKDVLGRHFSLLYPNETSETADALKISATKGYVENTGWRVRKNGERFWVTEMIMYLIGINPSQGFLVFIRENSDKKPSSGNSDSLHQWQYLFEHSDSAFAISYSDKNTIQLVNQAFAKMHGYSEDELIGKNINLIVPPEFQASTSVNLEQVTKRGHYLFESTHIRKDGTLIPVVADVTVIKGRSGKESQCLFYIGDVTELKEMQETSMLDKENFHKLFDQASDGIFTTDLNWHYTTVNTALCNMLGYSKNEIIGKSLQDFVSEKDVARLPTEKECLSKSGNSTVNEFKLIKKDGSSLPVEINAQIFENIGWHVIVRDITERNKTLGALIHSEQKFRGLLEGYQDAVIITDNRGIIDFVNTQFKNKFGYSPEEIIGKPLEQLLPERFRMKHVSYRMKYMANPNAKPMALTLDLYAQRKDGSEFPVDISLVPFETEDGMVFTAFIKDLSDRDRYVSQQKFLADISAILSENIEFEKRLYNAANLSVPFLADFCILFNCENNMLVPKISLHRDKSHQGTLKALTTDLFSRPEISPYKANAKTEDLKPMVLENVSDSFLKAITPDKEHFERFRELNPKSLLFVPLVAREKITGVVLLGMNSSGRKFSDEDISFISQVGHRMALSFDNINLYNEAQQAICDRENILSIVSHDLRNPLAAMKSGFQLIPQLVDKNEKEKINKITSSLVKASDFMEHLINDLLDFSKIQQGILPLKLLPTSVPQILEEVMEAVSFAAKDKSIEIHADIPKGDLILVCDPTRLKQAINNLIGNALKFTSEKGKINLRVNEEKDDFYFSVSDNGPGISGEDLLLIFDRFWQAPKTAHLGSGLGLFIAKGIIEAHRGTFWAESKIGQGSNFQFKIPKKQKIE